MKSRGSADPLAYNRSRPCRESMSGQIRCDGSGKKRKCSFTLLVTAVAAAQQSLLHKAHPSRRTLKCALLSSSLAQSVQKLRLRGRSTVTEARLLSCAVRSTASDNMCLLIVSIIGCLLWTAGPAFLATQSGGHHNPVGSEFWLLLIAFMLAIKVPLILMFFAATQAEHRGQYRRSHCALVMFGVLVVCLSMCCCFDADATVRRRGRDGREELTALRDLSIGDSVLSVDPYSLRTLWQPVLAKAHYSFADGAHGLSPMRRLVLEANASAITLSHTHFIFARRPGAPPLAPPERLLARDVQVGDKLLWRNASCAAQAAAETNAAPCSSWRVVAAVEPRLRRQKRAFFLASPFVLVSDVVASPYMQYAAMSADAQHAGFEIIHHVAPNAVLRQSLVSAATVPFLLINRAVQLLVGWE